MRKIVMLSIIALGIFINNQSNAQSIELIVFPNLSTIELAAFDFQNIGAPQPRIMQIVITPPNIDVYVEGTIDWRRNLNSGVERVGIFRTRIFSSRSFYNDEFNTSDIQIENTDYNSSITDEILRIGKPSGIFIINLRLFNPSGDLLDVAQNQFEFLNPTPPTIILPIEGSSYDIGAILSQWTPSIGASGYKVTANYADDDETNYELALTSRTPIINDYNVGNVTSVNLRDILSGELLPDTNVVMVVKAVIDRPGGTDELASPIVLFKTNSIGRAAIARQTNPDLIRLADLLSGQVNQEFLDKLQNGEISIDEIQFTDENGNPISFTDFVQLLNYLEQNRDAIQSINFSEQ